MTTDTATPAAAIPAIPAAAPAAQPATSTTIDSLIPAEGSAPAAAQPATDPAKPADVPAAAADEQAKWFYSDGAPGKGEPPPWYKATKYKTVEDQAIAYSELEKRFGSFTGAPRNGDYEFKLPEGVTGELDTSHPLFTQFTGWAKEAQLSQDGFNQVIGMLAKYEAAQAVNFEDVKKQVGEKADERIGTLVQWSKANLPGEMFNDVRAALSERNAATVFKVLEHVVGKMRQPAVPAPGRETIAAQPQGIDAVRARMREKDSHGNVKYFSDAQFRAEIDSAMTRAVQG